MPTYTYRCRKCGRQFELFHGIKDETPRRCPRCKGRAQRVPSGGTGILFRGSGFHVTDYRSASYREKAKREKSGGTPPGGTPSGGSGESGGSSGPPHGKGTPRGGSKPSADG